MRQDLAYRQHSLGEVLKDLSTRYRTAINYSPDFVPVDQRISLYMSEATLTEALDQLSMDAHLRYTRMGGQIALRASPDTQLQSPLPKRQRIGLLRQRTPPPPRQTSPIYPEARRPFRPPVILASNVDRRPTPTVAGSKRSLSDTAYRLVMPPSLPITADRRLAQISLLPYLGTNLGRSARMKNNLSVNVLWGTSKGVNGVEVGGILNQVREDVNGVQVAGLGNVVGGNVSGTQVAGLFNAADGHVTGVQAAPIFNRAGSAKAVQVALLNNRTRGDMMGVQAAGLFNVSGGKADGVQAALLFNTARDQARTQFSLLLNRAKGVSWGQMALINQGGRVKGFQIGLINLADTVSGVSLGLLNLVHRGYNRVEVSTSESLQGSIALKLGSHSFYNIFQVGARWVETYGGQPLMWGLGYGVGSSIGLSPTKRLNIELVGLHLNEGRDWTDQLNLLGQLRLTYEMEIGRHAGLFIGPTANLLLTRHLDAEGLPISSAIMPYHIYRATYADGTTARGWIGFQAGIRF